MTISRFLLSHRNNSVGSTRDDLIIPIRRIWRRDRSAKLNLLCYLNNLLAVFQLA